MPFQTDFGVHHKKLTIWWWGLGLRFSLRSMRFMIPCRTNNRKSPKGFLRPHDYAAPLGSLTFPIADFSSDSRPFVGGRTSPSPSEGNFWFVTIHANLIYLKKLCFISAILKKWLILSQPCVWKYALRSVHDMFFNSLQMIQMYCGQTASSTW